MGSTALGATIELADRMSAPLSNIVGALTSATHTCQMLDSASENMLDGESLNASGIESIRNSLQQAQAQALRMSETMADSYQRAIVPADGLRQKQEEYNRSIQDGSSVMNSLTSKLGALASVYSLKKVVDLSDTMAQNTARLDLMNDGLQTTEELQQQIYQSAQDARGSYLDMTNIVAKLGTLAGDAFSSSSETVAFAEQLQKQFVIAGAGVQETQAATLQLTQALASGVLRGDELNSIFEQAPTIIQSIASYLDVPVGKIRDMASEGQITGDIVKNAMFASADETNAKFESMPMTWAQVWTGICNKFVQVTQPILEAINWMANHWASIEPVVVMAAVAIGAYLVVLGLYHAQLALAAAGESACAIAKAIHTGATFAATKAQSGLNAAMLACPITWIIIALGAIVCAIYNIVQAYSDLDNKTYSTVGVIVGGLSVAWAFLVNLGEGVANVFLGVGNTLAAFFDNIGIAITNSILNIKTVFFSIISLVLDGISTLCEQLNKIPFIDIDTSGLNDAASNYAEDAQTAQDSKREYHDLGQSFSEGYTTFDTFSDGWAGDAYDKGYGAGSKLGEKVSDGVNKLKDGFKAPEASSSPALDTAANTAATADNTASIKDSLDITSENLKYIRDYAEQKVINRFTTAEIKVDMINHNSVSKDSDLDGIMDTFRVRLQQEMQAVAEGG